MRIGIDARSFGSSGHGHGRYTEMLLKTLAALPTHDTFYVFVRPQCVLPPLPNNFIVIRTSIKWYSWSEQLLYPLLLYRFRLDIMHFIHFNVPLLYLKKFIVTIHDLILLYYKDTHASTRHPWYYLFKYAAFKIVLRNAVTRATKIIAVSRYTAQDLMKHFADVKDKVSVIYPGITHLAMKQRSAYDRSSERPYLLYVGVAYPHKNLKFLIDQFQEWQESHPQYELILVGSHDGFYEAIERYLLEHRIKHVRHIGYVDDDALSALYCNATVFVFPSLHEGFGMPPLEAMQAGIPVLASNRTAIPEILGDAALYFDPTDKHDFKARLTQLIQDRSLQSKFRNAGFRQAEKYSWNGVAEKIHSLYSEI